MDSFVLSEYRSRLLVALKLFPAAERAAEYERAVAEIAESERRAKLCQAFERLSTEEMAERLA